MLITAPLSVIFTLSGVGLRDYSHVLDVYKQWLVHCTAGGCMVVWLTSCVVGVEIFTYGELYFVAMLTLSMGYFRSNSTPQSYNLTLQIFLGYSFSYFCFIFEV